MTKIFLTLVLLTLSGCATERVVYRDRPVEVKVAVPQPCATKRPVEPVRISDILTKKEWDKFDIVQQIAYLGIDLENSVQYGKDLNAATASCPEIEE